ncbi:MAG: VOC family protein [Alphaproteobacteria bacterium]|nr:VOC family protein [Alphaproteobacteria bacterium]
MEEPFGSVPKTGWAKMVPELLVRDVDNSLSFWRDLLGFDIAYRRPAPRFVYLERPEGAQIMLCQRMGNRETGPLESPYGRGAMFQVYIARLAPVLSALSARAWPIYEGPREAWRGIGDREGGQREVFVQDPDGYLVMVAEDLGERPLAS